MFSFEFKLYLRWLLMCLMIGTVLLHSMARDSYGGTWMLGAGGSFSSSPYKGYDSLSPVPLLGYEGEYLFIRGLQAGVKFSPWEFLEISAFAEYDPTSFHTEFTQDKRLKHLNERYEGLIGGVGIRASLPFGATFKTSFAADALGQSNGFVATANLEYPINIADLTISPSVGGRWASKNYLDYFYGVSSSESRRSGLKRYEATDGIDPSVGLRFSYNITEVWNVSAGCEAFFLSKSVTDSPMVDKNISITASAGILYSF